MCLPQIGVAWIQSVTTLNFMSRRIEQRTVYSADLADEWGPADEETQRVANRTCSTDADFRLFVRMWNVGAKERGDNTRIRSVEDES